MKPSAPPPPGLRRAAEQGSVRSLLLPLVCFALGLAVSTLWFQRPARPKSSRQPAPELSDGTKAVLERLTQPVQIHFYSLLDPGEAASLSAFAQRVDQLLAAYEKQSNGKIKVTRFDTQKNENVDEALTDGIKGFDLDKGQGCYLGVAFASGGKADVLPQLAPEWEPALEADVSRAIQRIGQVNTTPRATATVKPASATTLEQVRAQLPNLDSLSLDEGIRALREESVKEFAAAAKQMQARVEEAQNRLIEAKKSAAPAEQDAAMKQLQAIQAEQAQRLKEIAAEAQARIEAFKQLKSSAK